MVHVAEDAGLHHALVRGPVDRVVVALISDLEHAPRLRGGLHHALVPGLVPRHHLFAEHMLAGVEARRDDLGVHPQRHRRDDRLEVLVLEHVAELDVMLRGRLAVLLEDLVRRRERRRVDVGHRADLREVRVDVPEQRAPLAADADEADADGPAAHRSFHHRGRAHRGNSRNAGDRLEKIPTAEGHLFGREVHDSISNVAP